MAPIETAHTSGHQHVIAAPHADSAILGCDTITNLTPAIDTDPGTGVGVRAQIVDPRQATGGSVEPIDPPSRDRAVANSNVKAGINQDTTERAADTEHCETAQVERDTVGINSDSAFATLP